MNRFAIVISFFVVCFSSPGTAITIKNTTSHPVTVRVICNCADDSDPITIQAGQSYDHKNCSGGSGASCEVGLGHIDFYDWYENKTFFDNVGENSGGMGKEYGLGEFNKDETIELYVVSNSPRKLQMTTRKSSASTHIINSTPYTLVLRAICEHSDSNRFIRVKPGSDNYPFLACGVGRSQDIHFDFFAWDDNGKYFDNANGPLPKQDGSQGTFTTTQTVEILPDPGISTGWGNPVGANPRKLIIRAR